jgi:hypothetical protein
VELERPQKTPLRVGLVSTGKQAILAKPVCDVLGCRAFARVAGAATFELVIGQPMDELAQLTLRNGIQGIAEGRPGGRFDGARASGLYQY